jgi:hypothetical protein
MNAGLENLGGGGEGRGGGEVRTCSPSLSTTGHVLRKKSQTMTGNFDNIVLSAVLRIWIRDPVPF